MSTSAGKKAAPAPPSAEQQRLDEDDLRRKHWKRWGPYLSERAWGTVREDYSPYGTAWEFLPHDHARSKAYRWNEEGLGGVSDRHQFICLALALWNGRDPILKERLFGLTGNEGNHGEDCKEYYFYLDSTPTHSYMKALYKYPQAAYPYAELVAETLAKRDGRTGRALSLWELYRRGFDTHHIFSVDEFYWEDRPRYYAELDAVRHAGDDLSGWLEYCAAGLRTTLERAWLRIQTIQGNATRKLALRPRQEQLLHLLRDHGSMAPNEIWSALSVSRQGAMDLLRPLIEAGLVEKVGGAKTGHYVLKNV